MENRWMKLFKDNRSFLLFIVLMLCFRSAVADWNEVPTGSMKPTILEGDRIWVQKMAYDIRVPFTHISLLKRGDPERGDIVVFDSAVSDIRLVKRVVGLPGDVVSLARNELLINGVKAVYEEIAVLDSARDQLENLLGVEHVVRTANDDSMLSSFPAVKVPADHYLVLGDNRDNSSDSRVIGFVPRNEIVGKSTHVVLSLDYENYYLPRPDRFWQPL